MGLAIVMSAKRFEAAQKAQKAKERLRAIHIEWGMDFTEEKFTQIFKNLLTTSIPDSHCLVFWYASLEDGRDALRSGIPATSAHGGGIVFTFNPPHKLDSEDTKVFPETSREVVLVCSIPREFLDRLPEEKEPVLMGGENFKLTKDEKQGMKKAFKAFDTDNSGKRMLCQSTTFCVYVRLLPRLTLSITRID